MSERRLGQDAQGKALIFFFHHAKNVSQKKIVNLFLGRIAEGATGFVISGALLAYLLLLRVKNVFRGGNPLKTRV